MSEEGVAKGIRRIVAYTGQHAAEEASLKASKIMKDVGASSVRAICTHPVLSGNAYENIEQSLIEELIVTDTLPINQQSSKIKVLTIANLFSDVIHNMNKNKSISSQFII